MEKISLKWVSPFWYLGCEQNCPVCFIGNKKNICTSWEIRKRAINTLAQYHTEKIFYCGGNPILDPLIEQTVKYTKSKGILVEILSNSWDLDKNKHIKNKDEFLKNIDDKAATFWGEDAKTHDSLCGCKGSFAKLINNLKKISDRGHSITCVINVVPRNKDRIYSIIKRLKKKVNITKVWLQRIFPYGNTSRKNYQDILLQSSDFNLILKQLLKAKKDFQLEEISFDSTPPFCMVNKKYWPFLEEYKRGISFWALDYKCRLFGESFDVTKPRFALFNKKPIYKINNLLEKIKSDPKTQEILAKKYLTKKCKNCKIKDCFGGYLIRNQKDQLTVDPALLNLHKRYLYKK